MNEQPPSARFDALPHHSAIVELGTHPQWVAWRWANRDGKLSKPPVSPRTGQGASHSRPADWTDLDTASAFAASQGMAGVGFVLSETDGFTGADLDKCRDPDTGMIDPWAREILDLAETYCEISPSGSGLRLIWRGKVPATIKCDAARVEVYRSKRYLTITGDHVTGTPTDIGPAPETLRRLIARVDAFKATATTRSRLHESDDGTVMDLESGEIFDSFEEAERAFQAPTKQVEPTAGRTQEGEDFFATVNARALSSLSSWVPTLFPAARPQAGTGAWRVSSRALGRDLKEDLSIAPNGIVDFGVADMGDRRQGKRSAIDLCMEYGRGSDAADAALWLCERMAIDPASIGWRSGADPVTAALGAAAAERMAANGNASSSQLAPAESGAGASPIDLWRKSEPPPFPTGLLPQVIEEFAQVRGDMIGADPSGLAVAALVTCAALISDRIRLRMKRHDDWTEPAQLWAALIGMPSTKKSPIINAAVKPLFAIDAIMASANREAIAEYEELKKAGEKPRRPRTPRLRIEDVSIEAAQEILADSPNGILAFQDELSGWFGAMERYSGQKGGQKDRAFWLQSYNGGTHDVARIGRGHVHIENLSVCLLGGIQPDLIRKLAGDTYDDGLLQRMIPIVLRSATMGKDEPMPNVAAQYAWVAERLHQMQRPFVGGHGDLSGSLEVDLVFDDEGQEVWREVEKRHHDLAGLEIVNRKLASAVGKYNGIFGRLCVTFHCIENAECERPPRVIPGELARRVADFLHRFLFPHAIAFYGEIIGMADDQDMLTEVAGFLLAHPELTEITFRNFARGSSMMRRCKDAKAVEAILDRLDAFGWLDRKPTERNQTSARWAVVPAIHVRFADRAKSEAARRSRIRTLAATYADAAE